MTINKILVAAIYVSLAIAVALAVSCRPYRCYPSKRSKDYATVQKLILRSDGYIHSIATNGANTYQAFYECKPDSVQIGSVVWVGNYQRVRTGGRMQVGVGLLPVQNKRSIFN